MVKYKELFIPPSEQYKRHWKEVDVGLAPKETLELLPEDFEDSSEGSESEVSSNVDNSDEDSKPGWRGECNPCCNKGARQVG
eukprot:CAMPEP_0194782064 /NCGR_PEP_ID=MMETSP0323_2-20130528/78024_1 /TAXON_ID=2866 ORGANISM="Crypthecodinium cohnii, Strain Seligo" /NCGR_SAMPLE_ID=MMETSP0323_2 /ASSEMBLY_ACC=CAM_ASM_000346 /LENGTH=81 /DNA_ID=CAMNT_0039720769 /DNA_START=12 /DNA_END=254 /DNA_ORIENTATION=-